MCLPPFRDLIKVLKWYVDRITEVERQEHIQEVLKVTSEGPSGARSVALPRGTGPSVRTGVGGGVHCTPRI